MVERSLEGERPGVHRKRRLELRASIWPFYRLDQAETIRPLCQLHIQLGKVDLRVGVLRSLVLERYGDRVGLRPLVSPECVGPRYRQLVRPEWEVDEYIGRGSTRCSATKREKRMAFILVCSRRRRRGIEEESRHEEGRGVC